MAGNARRPRVGGVRGHVWAPQTKARRPACLARYVARRSRAPYLRRWALLIALAVGHDGVQKLAQGPHPGTGRPVRLTLLIAQPEQLVGDVERGERQ